MDVKKIASALSSETRLKILKILAKKELSSVDVYRGYIRIYNDKKHRESIYRDLEVLVTAELLEKKYDSSSKQIIYHLKVKKITLDLTMDNLI